MSDSDAVRRSAAHGAEGRGGLGRRLPVGGAGDGDAAPPVMGGVPPLPPADGFFEPKGPKTLKKRQPYFFQRPDRDVFAFAGLWDRWNAPDGRTVETCVLLTTSPNELMRPIHDRMPVIVDEKDFDRWLDRDVPGDAVADLLKPTGEPLETWRVLDMVEDPDTNKGIRAGVKEP